MWTSDEILRKYEDEYEYHFHDLDREWIIKAMEEYSEQNCTNIQSIYKKPTLELKPLEDLYREENPHTNNKFYLPDTTQFYKWIRMKIIGS